MNWIPKASLPLLTILAGAGCCFAQLGYKDTYQVNYLSNLQLGGANVNITSAGVYDFICVNAYVYSADAAPLSCCTCLVDFNSASHLMNFIPAVGVINSVTIKLVASTPRKPQICDPTKLSIDKEPIPNLTPVPTTGGLATGMRAWATRLHISNTGSFGDGTAFSKAPLAQPELDRLTSNCASMPLASRCTCGSGYL
jgi:hypothetical protein